MKVCNLARGPMWHDGVDSRRGLGGVSFVKTRCIAEVMKVMLIHTVR